MRWNRFNVNGINSVLLCAERCNALEQHGNLRDEIRQRRRFGYRLLHVGQTRGQLRAELQHKGESSTVTHTENEKEEKVRDAGR